MAEQSRFDTVAAQYAAGRPDYPDRLFETLERTLGRPLVGLDAVDLGAGTGIASRQLAERGARVVAVELSRPMVAELAATSPGVRAVQASATALPLADAGADLVTCAQAWHWIDPDRAVPEVRRVLRAGGVFALWWNFTSRDDAWAREQEARITAVAPDWRKTPYGKDRDRVDPALRIEEHVFSWERTIALDRFLQSLASKSYIAALPDTAGFLAAEREILLARFPDGQVTERFDTKLTTAREKDAAAR